MFHLEKYLKVNKDFDLFYLDMYFTYGTLSAK